MACVDDERWSAIGDPMSTMARACANIGGARFVGDLCALGCWAAMLAWRWLASELLKRLAITCDGR